MDRISESDTPPIANQPAKVVVAAQRVAESAEVSQARGQPRVLIMCRYSMGLARAV